MNYEGLSAITNSQEAHVGGNISEGDPFTFSPSVWNYLIHRFAVKSVLDLGSGLGYSSQYFFRSGLQILATDGLKENCEKSVYPTFHCDMTKSSVFCKVDLVHCQEVVEHIEEHFLENLLQSLSCGRFIVMTHALPGQGGYHHVNEKPIEYWVGHLKRYDCHLLAEDTARVRKLAEIENATFLAQSGLVFVNRSR